ncbi:MAG TPA: LptA/OstA family protein [Allosphingosinicella sp.]|jgi:lipopolysaccharide export system protein LptA
MRTFSIAAGSAVAAALLLAVAPVAGQEPASVLKGHDSNASILVGSDRIEVQDNADRAILTGNVVVQQDQLTLNAERLTINYVTGGGLEIKRIDASGGVTMRSPSETATGQYGIYDLERGIITLVGGVVLTRGENRVSGGRLVLELDSGRAVMDGGGPPAPDAPRGTITSTNGRVNGVFKAPRRTTGSNQ